MRPRPELVPKLERMLRDAPDVELTHVRPFAVARGWGDDRWEVLRLFLQATRCGLLNFSWEVLCPNCRSTRQPRATSLGQVRQSSHCEVCQIKFDGEFDKWVELKFSVHPNVRPCDAQTFCLAGPGGKPHIYSQLLIGPGQSRPWKLPPVNRPFRMRSPQVKEPLILSGRDVPRPARNEWGEDRGEGKDQEDGPPLPGPLLPSQGREGEFIRELGSGISRPSSFLRVRCLPERF